MHDSHFRRPIPITNIQILLPMLVARRQRQIFTIECRSLTTHYQHLRRANSPKFLSLACDFASLATSPCLLSQKSLFASGRLHPPSNRHCHSSSVQGQRAGGEVPSTILSPYVEHKISRSMHTSIVGNPRRCGVDV